MCTDRGELSSLAGWSEDKLDIAETLDQRPIRVAGRQAPSIILILVGGNDVE